MLATLARMEAEQREREGECAAMRESLSVFAARYAIRPDDGDYGKAYEALKSEAGRDLLAERDRLREENERLSKPDGSGLKDMLRNYMTCLKMATLTEERDRLAARVAELEGGERCQQCQRLYADVYSLPDELWSSITPKPETPEAGLLCPVCALGRLAAQLSEVTDVAQDLCSFAGEPLSKYAEKFDAAEKRLHDFVAAVKDKRPTEYEKLAARCKAMEEALKPFAIAGNNIHTDWPDSTVYGPKTGFVTTVGDCRRAADVLREGA